MPVMHTVNLSQESIEKLSSAIAEKVVLGMMMTLNPSKSQFTEEELAMFEEELGLSEPDGEIQE